MLQQYAGGRFIDVRSVQEGEGVCGIGGES